MEKNTPESLKALVREVVELEIATAQPSMKFTLNRGKLTARIAHLKTLPRSSAPSGLTVEQPAVASVAAAAVPTPAKVTATTAPTICEPSLAELRTLAAVAFGNSSDQFSDYETLREKFFRRGLNVPGLSYAKLEAAGHTRVEPKGFNRSALAIEQSFLNKAIAKKNK